MPIKRPADMIEYLRTMPAEEIAVRQAALRVARSRFFYMQLPHSHGTTSSQVTPPCRLGTLDPETYPCSLQRAALQAHQCQLMGWPGPHGACPVRPTAAAASPARLGDVMRWWPARRAGAAAAHVQARRPRRARTGAFLSRMRSAARAPP